LVLGIFGLLPGTQNSENVSKQERVI
jgi:hypothetical protein